MTRLKRIWYRFHPGAWVVLAIVLATCVLSAYVVEGAIFVVRLWDFPLAVLGGWAAALAFIKTRRPDVVAYAGICPVAGCAYATVAPEEPQLRARMYLHMETEHGIVAGEGAE